MSVGNRTSIDLHGDKGMCVCVDKQFVCEELEWKVADQNHEITLGCVEEEFLTLYDP